jgi:uncharacterized protein
MHRQIIVVFLSLFWLAPSAWAEGERGALFKARQGEHVLYLFGTMHVGAPGFYPLEPRISAALAQASVLALEVDPGRDGAEQARDMARFGMFAAGERGYDLMAPALRVRLEKVLARHKMELGSVARLRPWLLATVLALQEFGEQGYRPELAVDAHLAQLARQRKLPVVELESAGAQLALFERLTPAQQWQFLEDTIDAIESGKQGAQVREIAQAWARADQKALDAFAAEAEQDGSTSGRFVQQVLLEERNGPMADKLARQLAREAVSVAAIGVLHLVGARSVPALLRQRGIVLERVY